ncbi:putative PAN/Apple domain-containing protein [Septoria linicola]|nr:putative PAN/Apple domain-containing protein [Septoria linicola]
MVFPVTSYATNTGYSSGSDTYTIKNGYSWSYSDPGTNTCPQGNQPKPCPNPKPVGPLTACPQPLQYIVGANRILYSVCLDTDYQIPSPEIYSNTVNNRACSNQCNNQQGCTKALYNPQYHTCYLKGSPSVANENFQKNPGFQTLERIPENTPLTSCLAPTYGITQGGVSYTVCPSSHTNNAAVLNYWTGIPGGYQCAQKCNSVSSCKKFVYNWATQECWNIGNANLAQSGWATFDNINTYYVQ